MWKLDCFTLFTHLRYVDLSEFLVSSVWGTSSPVWGQGHMFQDDCLKMVSRFTLCGGQGEPHHRGRAVDLNHWQRERECRMVFRGLCTSLVSTHSWFCEIPHGPAYLMGEGSAVLCVPVWPLMGHGCWVLPCKFVRWRHDSGRSIISNRSNLHWLRLSRSLYRKIVFLQRRNQCPCLIT